MFRRWPCLPVLMAVLTLVSVSPAADLEQVRSRYYQIATDVDGDLAREIAEHMDLVYAEYAKRFRSFPTRARTRNPLIVFRKHADYIVFLSERGIDGTGSGGMFFVQSGESGLVTFLENQTLSRMFHTLRHEGFHQFAYARIGPQLPTWANEGLAEYFAESIVVNRRLSPGQAPVDRVAVLQQAVKQGRHLPFAELLTISGDRWSERVRTGDGSLQYDQSWAVVHFLVEGDRRYQRAFDSYLLRIARGTSAEQAATEVFGTDHDAFESAWIEYIGQLEPTPESTAAARLEFLAAGMQFLKSRGRSFDTLAELKDQLQSAGFAITYPLGHGLTVRMSAAEAENFTAPPSPNRRRGRTPTIKLLPTSDAKLLPEILITGLQAPVRLKWRLDDAGVVQSRIVWQ